MIPQELDPSSGLPIGPKVRNSAPARAPARVVLEGRYCRLEPLETRHGEQLHAASSPPEAAARFRYMAQPAPDSQAATLAWIDAAAAKDDPLFFAVIDKRTGRCEGRQAYMRIAPAHRSLEIGSIYWGPAIAGTQVATEANFLFASHAFDELGYRRYEWKCDALNAPSRRAAERFGFTYEGTHRRALIVRGRTRDTAWFSIVEEEWPALSAAYATWLDPANFDADGVQRTRLSELTRAARTAE